MQDVYFFEAFAEEAELLRSLLPPNIRAEFTDKTIQETGMTEAPAPLISIRTQSAIPVAWAKWVSGILARATGHDHLAAYRKAAGVAVPGGYLPLYCARAVAEQAMLLWMGLLRKLPQQTRHFRTFERDGLTGRECEGRHLLVVGVGNIGSQVVRVGKALGMTVKGVDIVRRESDVEYVSIDEGLPWAEVLVCAMNLTETNRGYFRYNVLRNARHGLIFVNVSRGEFVVASDLVRLLDEKRLGGVGLDVYSDEPRLAVQLRRGQAPTDLEAKAVLSLSERPSAILTPHNAFNTREAVQRKAEQSIEQVRVFLETGAFKWPVP